MWRRRQWTVHVQYSYVCTQVRWRRRQWRWLYICTVLLCVYSGEVEEDAVEVAAHMYSHLCTQVMWRRRQWTVHVQYFYVCTQVRWRRTQWRWLHICTVLLCVYSGEVEEEAVEVAVLSCPYAEEFTIRQADLRCVHTDFST